MAQSQTDGLRLMTGMSALLRDPVTCKLAHSGVVGRAGKNLRFKEKIFRFLNGVCEVFKYFAKLFQV